MLVPSFGKQHITEITVLYSEIVEVERNTIAKALSNQVLTFWYNFFILKLC